MITGYLDGRKSTPWSISTPDKEGYVTLICLNLSARIHYKEIPDLLGDRKRLGNWVLGYMEAYVRKYRMVIDYTNFKKFQMDEED